MEGKVGKLFTLNGKDVWRLISYCKYPTVTFENVETKERIGGGVSSLNVKDFKELIIKEKEKK